MSEVSDRAESRLEKLTHIEPLLASMRVLSLSTMQMAQNRKETLFKLQERYHAILIQLVALLSRLDLAQIFPERQSQGDVVLVVLGSDRGICGTYNQKLTELVVEWQQKTINVGKIIAYGTRLERNLTHAGLSFDFQGSLKQGSVPQYAKAQALVQSWLHAFNRNSIQRVDVCAFRKVPEGFFHPEISTLLPVREKIQLQSSDLADWPPVIIEGDPLPIIRLAVDHLIAIDFYDLILESIIAENSIRYGLLEEAKSNTSDLIDSLSIELQMEKRQAITREIQEIAVSAGLTI